MRLPREFTELPRIRELITAPNTSDINCHKAVLFLSGKISAVELSSDSKAERQQGAEFTFGSRARAISDTEFIPISNTDQLYALADLECDEGVLCLGQILDSKDDELAHSFIIAKKGGDFICFDKSGFKEPFRFYHLGELLEKPNYQNQHWRFVPMNELA